MNWRFLLVIVISLGIHLTLLVIRFQSNGSGVVGEPNLVGLVSGTLAKFTPADTSDDSVHPKKQRLEPQQLQLLSPVRNIPSPLHPSLLRTLIAAHAEIMPAEMLESKIVEIVAMEPVSPEPLSTIAMSNVEVSNSLLPEKISAGLVVSLEAGDEGRGLQTEGVANQIVPLAYAVPRYADNPRPQYPEVARRKGWSGEVRLLVLVDEVGDVGRISIDRSSGYSALDRAARRAVRLWRFVPAAEGGRKVASEVVVPIDFRLPASDHSAIP